MAISKTDLTKEDLIKMNIDIIGNKRILTHRGNNLSRTLLDDVPEKEDASNFNLQIYLDKIKAKSDTVNEKWSI